MIAVLKGSRYSNHSRIPCEINVYTSSGKRSCLAQWSISHIPLCCSGGVRSRRILILISRICWFQPPAQHGLSIFATTSAFSVFHPASGWTSGWMMVVEAMTCFVSDRSIKLTGKEGLPAVQIASTVVLLSCHVKIHIDSPKQIKKRIPSQSMFHKCWCLDMRRHLEARRTPQMSKMVGQIGVKGASKKVVLVYRSQDQLHLEPSGLQVELLANLRVSGWENKSVNILKLLMCFSLQCVRMCLDHISYIM